MKLKILIILAFSISAFYAQDDKTKNPNVELPDFVITGKSPLNIKKVDKIKPDFVSSINEDFIKPTFSPEEFEVGSFSNPLKSDMSFLNDVHFYKGNISAGVGLYTIPTVSGNYAHPFTNGIIEGMFNGDFTRAYEDFSDSYRTRFGFNLTYWSDINNETLPGTQFNLNGNYGTSSFKFFASANPKEKRTLNYGKIEADIKNDFGKNFLFGLTLTDYVANISEEEFLENNFRLKGEALIKLNVVNVGATIDYQNHSIKNLLGSDSGKDFLLLRPTAGLHFTKLVKGTFGWTFSRAAGNTYNAIYASVALKLDKNLTVFGEFAPTSEFMTPGSFAIQNHYLNVDSIGSIYWERSGALTASIKYEYDKYFQIDGGLKYFTSDKFPYFGPSSDSGKFDLHYIDMKSISPFANFLFYLGPYGEFYSSLEVSDVRDVDGNQVPYLPLFKFNAEYSYKFKNGLTSIVKMDYQSKRFADVANKISIGDYFDLGLSFIYSFQPNLDLTLDINNLVNQKNYFWYGYREVPINIIVGVNFRL
ncbi:MAG: hypothetical protein WAR59_15115 [Ignavibacteriaceae bacterium]